MKKFNVAMLFVITLFFVNVVFYLFRYGAEQLGGDETAAYLSLMPFLHALMAGKFLPTFLVFFHESIFQIVQLPMTVFGASLFFVRLPSLIIGSLYFLAIYKLGRLIFGKKTLYVLSLLGLYVFSAYSHVLRLELNHGLFNLILATSLYYFIKFDQERNTDDLLRSFKLLLVNFFVYVDVVFAGLGFLISILRSKINKNVILSHRFVIPALIATFLFIGWSISVYAGSILSGAYIWQQQAPFSLLNRGTSYSLLAITDNISLFRSNTSLEYFIFILGFLFISVFDKRSRPIWALLIGPLVYFNLVRMPTVHLFNFITLILVGTTIGMQATIEHFPKTKYLIIIFICVALFKNALLFNFSSPFGADRDYKIAATFIRKITPLCDKVFINTSLDGYAFRFYFDRGYVTEVNNRTRVGFVDGDSSQLESLGFGKVAEVKRQGKPNLSVYQRDYLGDISELNFVDQKLFTFSNTITYISECFKK